MIVIKKAKNIGIVGGEKNNKKGTTFVQAETKPRKFIILNTSNHFI